jgi:hypothetical protein
MHFKIFFDLFIGQSSIFDLKHVHILSIMIFFIGLNHESFYIFKLNGQV